MRAIHLRRFARRCALACAPSALARALPALACALVVAGCGEKRLAWEGPPASAPDVSAIACLAANLPATADARAAQAAGMRALGLAQVRWELIWRDVERQRGVWDFAAVDAALAALDAAGGAAVAPIIALAYGNTLYSAAGAAASDSYYPPDDPADYARFAGAAAAHLAPRVATFEIWNEENAGYRFWKPAADPAAYARLFQAAAAAIRAACRSCAVLLGAPVTLDYPTVPAGPAFLRDALAALPLRADGAGVHPYPLYPPCSPPEGGPNRCNLWPGRDEVGFADQLASIAAATGAPLWITELGWPTFKPNSTEVTEAQQAAWLLRAQLLAARAGVSAACVWTWSDDSRSGSFPPEGDFGLRRQDGSAKPSFDAWADLLARARPGRFIRDRAGELGLREGEHALLFAGAQAGQLLTFLWREEDFPARTVAVRLHGAATALAPGQPSAAGVSVGELDAQVPLGPWPVALVETAAR